MDEDSRNFDVQNVTPGAGPEGVASMGPKSILYQHSYVADQIKCNEE